VKDEAHVTDLIPAYAIACLDAQELEQVERHLAACPACQAELNAFRELAASLALTVPQVDPPARLKQAILRQTQPRPVPQSQPGLWARLAGFFRVVQPVWAVVSLVLILVLVGSNLALWQQVQQEQAKATATVSQGVFHTVHLQAPDAVSQVTALLVISDNGDTGTLVVDGLKPLDNGQQYQVWLVKNGQRTSGAVFSGSPDGYEAVVINSSMSLLSYDSFGVTIEPWGGSPGPTGPKVLGGSL
jgi:anti-sigma-K factor RskA